jgi:hypothetical protein
MCARRVFVADFALDAETTAPRNGLVGRPRLFREQVRCGQVTLPATRRRGGSGLDRKHPVRELGAVEARGDPPPALPVAEAGRQARLDEDLRGVEHLGAEAHAFGRRQAPVLRCDESLELRGRISHPYELKKGGAGIRVRDPNQLKRVKVGDQVQATFTDAVAISVEPAPSRK